MKELERKLNQVSIITCWKTTFAKPYGCEIGKKPIFYNQK
ncbi:hypothetical protein B4168_2452 [Anoxybacillus flavithermus]|nr:hypothetical protein B4168_2452 [Anoxybacillus flavithermus]OAO85328.1 hypothetical protein GT23_3019 [Parageobacillus thermoglucosidasius]